MRINEDGYNRVYKHGGNAKQGKKRHKWECMGIFDMHDKSIKNRKSARMTAADRGDKGAQFREVSSTQVVYINNKNFHTQATVKSYNKKAKRARAN